MLDPRVVRIRMLQILAFGRERSHCAQRRVEMSVIPLVGIDDLLSRRLVNKLMRKPINARFLNVNRVFPRQRMGYCNQPMLVRFFDQRFLQLNAGHVELLTHG